MSKGKNWRIRILHIRDEITNIREFIAGKERAGLDKNIMLVHALVRSIQIIGEAAKKIPDDIKKQHPGIPWADMAGMRDKLVHDYDDVDLDLLWRVAIEEIPSLEKEINNIPVSEKDL